MKRKRHSPEQVIRKLREADGMLSEGKEIAAVCQALEVSEATFHRLHPGTPGLSAACAATLDFQTRAKVA